ncbi:MAG: glucokinase [Cyanobacteria bacterium J06641_5]
MSTYIAGDIGGTNTRLRLFSGGSAATDRSQTIHREYPSQGFPDLVPIVREFLADAPAELAPKAACFAVAGPVTGGRSELTNLDWPPLECDRLQKALDLERVELINDFAAMSYGAIQLVPDDLCDLQVCEPRTDAPIGVIGAGTGLGQAFLVPSGSGHVVFPAEGGHAGFAPRNELEDGLLRYLRQRQTHVSAENVISGPGILAIYQFLRDRGGEPEAADVAERVRAWEQGQLEPKAVTPLISLAAKAQSNALCELTLETFVGAYASEAGNFALKLLPYGGLYIAGGIAAKNLDLLERYGFLAALKEKGPMSGVLENVPVRVVLNEDTGLLGAMAWVQRTNLDLK